MCTVYLDRVGRTLEGRDGGSSLGRVLRAKSHQNINWAFNRPFGRQVAYVYFDPFYDEWKDDSLDFAQSYSLVEYDC